MATVMAMSSIVGAAVMPAGRFGARSLPALGRRAFVVRAQTEKPSAPSPKPSTSIWDALVLSVASLVPLLQGESAEGRAGIVINANAELWNGRFAMLGLVALAATEIITGAPFINI